jgi:homopolymeric O-antigen transport system permease protein
MLQLIREVHRNRELIWALALKELRVRYKRSALGFLWALLNPLMTMVILTIVFSTIANLGIKQYSVFLISALLPWTFFAQTMSYAVESLVGNGTLLKKIRIDKSVFPVAAVLSNVINFMFWLAPLCLILLVLRFPFHWTWVYLPLPLLSLVLFTAGCSFFVAAANVFFRDVAHIIQIVLSAWFYLSPVMYAPDFPPLQRYHLLFRLNPMLYLLNEFRLAIYYGRLPTVQSVVISLVIGMSTLVLGYAFFRHNQEKFVYYV